MQPEALATIWGCIVFSLGGYLYCCLETGHCENNVGHIRLSCRRRYVYRKENQKLIKRVLRLLTIAAILGSVFATVRSNAQTITETLSDVGRGLVRSSGTNNLNTSSGNILVGSLGVVQYANHFDFAIPEFTQVWSATLVITDNYAHTVAASTTYSVSALSEADIYTFSDIGTGTAYGSAIIPGSANVNPYTVDISLNSAALAAIQADRGSVFTLGGVDAGTGTYSDFNTGSVSTLYLVVSAPEPGANALAVGCLVTGAVGFLRRRSGRR